MTESVDIAGKNAANREHGGGINGDWQKQGVCHTKQSDSWQRPTGKSSSFLATLRVHHFLLSPVFSIARTPQ
jgi:hypothetical protein